MKTFNLLYDRRKQGFLGLAGHTEALGIQYWNCDGDVVHAELSDVVVCDIDVPDWLPVWDFLRHVDEWRLAWAMGLNKEWPEAWQRFIVFNTKSAVRIAVIRLLNTVNFRSSMAASSKDQVVEWLNAEPRLRRYSFPLSRRQLEFLVFATDRDIAKQIQSSFKEERVSE